MTVFDLRYRKPIFSAIVLLAFCAIALRLLPLGNVLTDGAVYLYDGDNYLHIRKILLHLNAFPKLASRDYFEGYPVGTGVIWAPLLDQLFAGIGWIVSAGDPDRALVEKLVVFAPPVVGGLTVLLAGLLTARFYGGAAGLLASIFLLLMPAHIDTTIVGRFDNEMIEPLLLLFTIFGYLNLASNKSAVGRRAVLVMALFVALLFWRGSTVILALVFVTALVETLVARKNENWNIESGRLLADTSTVFFYLAGSIALFCVLNPWGNQDGIRFNVISWFHVLISFAAAVVLYLFSAWISEKKRFRLVLPVVGITTFLLSFALFSKNFSAELLSGLGVIGVGKDDPWIASIIQYQSLFQGGAQGAGQTWRFGTMFWLIVPFSLWLLLRGLRESSRPFLVIALLAIALFALTVARVRFMNFLSVTVAIACAVALIDMSLMLSRKLDKRGPVMALVAVITVILTLPYARFAAALPAYQPGVSPRGYIMESMLWLRDNTERIAEPYNFEKMPGYSVLARWDFSGWITAIAERPTVATLYGTETFGMQPMARFYLSQEADEALTIMREVGARYVISSKVIGTLDTYALLLGRDPGRYVHLEKADTPSGAIYKPGRDYLDLVSTRLLLSDGVEQRIGRIHFRPVPGFRLVYESDEKLNLAGFPYEVKNLKIFERIEGMRLQLRGKPLERVDVTGTVVTNRQREFTWRWSGRLDDKGHAQLRLPYAMRDNHEQTGMEEEYRVRISGKDYGVTVTAEDLKDRFYVIDAT